jgi:hypothetical protein
MRITLKSGKKITRGAKTAPRAVAAKVVRPAAVPVRMGGVTPPPKTTKGVRITLRGGRIFTVAPGTKITLPSGRRFVVGTLQSRQLRRG